MDVRPTYADDHVSIYHGDARQIAADLIPTSEFGVLVTDPPYGQAFRSGWTGAEIAGDADTAARDAILDLWDGPAIVFGRAGEALLDGFRAALVWHRPGSGMGDLRWPWKPDYELIHVRGEGFRSPNRGTSVLSVPWDDFRGRLSHPHQKPIGLMRSLLAACPPEWSILDPFCGSGSTLRAAKDLGRQAVGIDSAQRYCRIAAERCGQEAFDLGVAA